MLRSGVLRLAGCCSTQCSRRASTFTVLGIETSCDDTGVAVVRSDGAVLGEARVTDSTARDSSVRDSGVRYSQRESGVRHK